MEDYRDFPPGIYRFRLFLKTQRDKRGMSQTDCANACGITRYRYEALENSRCAIRPDEMQMLAQGLNLNLAELCQNAGYGGFEEPSSP